MKLNWLATTAVALLMGSGAVIAQAQSDHKRGEGPQAQAPAAKDQKKEHRGEAAAAAEHKQAQQPKDAQQPARHSQDTHQKGEPSTAGAEPTHDQQTQEHKKGRDSKQANQPKQKHDNQARDNNRPEQKNEARDTNKPEQKKQARDAKQPEQKKQARDAKQPEQKKQARDAKHPSDTKQTQQQPPTQNHQPSTSTKQPSKAAQQPSTSSTQQSAQQPSSTTQGRTTGQATNQKPSGASTTSATANDPQRTKISERLSRNKTKFNNQNINISVSIGERLPPRVRMRPLPADIVRIEPRYRGYDYTIVQDEVVIVEPRTKKVVDVIREPGSSGTASMSSFRSERVTLTSEQRETLKQSAHRLSSAPVSGTPSGSMSADSSCLTLQPVPDELTRANPQLGQYRMLAIGDQVVLIDPTQQKVVDVVE